MEKVAELAIQRTSSLEAQKIMKIQLGMKELVFAYYTACIQDQTEKKRKII